MPIEVPRGEVKCRYILLALELNSGPLISKDISVPKDKLGSRLLSIETRVRGAGPLLNQSVSAPGRLLS